MVRHNKKKASSKKKKKSTTPRIYGLRWPGESTAKSTVPKKQRRKYGYHVEDRDRQKFKNIKRPRIAKKKSQSAVDREMAKERRARYYHDKKFGIKEQEIVETMVVGELVRPRRRSERRISPNVADTFREVKTRFRVVDKNQRTLLEVFPGVLSKTETRKLTEHTKRLFEKSKPLSDREDTRHIGTWPDYQKYFFYTKETREFIESARFLEYANTGRVVKKLNTHLRQHFKNIHDKYKSLEMPLEMRLVGRAFPTAAINSAASPPHYDNSDCKQGLCYVTPYGSFEGGDLIFRDLKLHIKCQPGDVVAFDSEGLYHENLPITKGERFSLVMFCHQHCFDIKPNKEMS